MTEAFGPLLKTIRKQRHMTQQALACRLSVHRNSIVAWERGDYLPATHDRAVKIATQLECSNEEMRIFLQAALFLP